MESKRIYEESHEELVRINKSMVLDEFSINTAKLDAETKGQLITAINNVIYERSKAIEKIILGVD